jgi:pimeloyl-ACP methyl ester carboxylesterase
VTPLTEKPPRPPARAVVETAGAAAQVDAGVLNIAYYEAGPADGPVVMLMHGFPYDIHAYVDVAPQLAAQGCRVIVPYLRGYGPTRFRDRDAALGRAGGDRRRHDGADGCAWDQARGVRGL